MMWKRLFVTVMVGMTFSSCVPENPSTSFLYDLNGVGWPIFNGDAFTNCSMGTQDISITYYFYPTQFKEHIQIYPSMSNCTGATSGEIWIEGQLTFRYPKMVSMTGGASPGDFGSGFWANDVVFTLGGVEQNHIIGFDSALDAIYLEYPMYQTENNLPSDLYQTQPFTRNTNAPTPP